MKKLLILSIRIVFLSLCASAWLCSFARADITTGLVGWWKLDDTGSNAIDSSGQGYTGTITNSPAVTTNCRAGNCLSFSAVSSQYVNVSGFTSDTYFTGASNVTFSVAFWFLHNWNTCWH